MCLLWEDCSDKSSTRLRPGQGRDGNKPKSQPERQRGIEASSYSFLQVAPTFVFAEEVDVNDEKNHERYL